jgi:hypothetical protein
VVGGFMNSEDASSYEIDASSLRFAGTAIGVESKTGLVLQMQAARTLQKKQLFFWGAVWGGSYTRAFPAGTGQSCSAQRFKAVPQMPMSAGRRAE